MSSDSCETAPAPENDVGWRNRLRDDRNRAFRCSGVGADDEGAGGGTGAG